MSDPRQSLEGPTSHRPDGRTRAKLTLDRLREDAQATEGLVTFRKKLSLHWPASATPLLTRVAGRHTALLCERVTLRTT